MKTGVVERMLIAAGLAGSLTTAAIHGGRADTVDAHVAAARLAAGQDFSVLFTTLCSPASIEPGPAPPGGGGPPARRPAPDRQQWHADPVKVFDNLYFLGQTEVSTWAVTTSAGIIVIDTIYDYSVEDEVVGGLKTLGLNPADIKYAIVSHGHRDHAGGAKYLQDHFATRIVASAADWDLMERSAGLLPVPRRDIVAADGQTLTLGDTTVTMYLTPGHTPGTISTLVPVKDGGRPHLAAAWGGTIFDFVRSPDAFKTYIASVTRFQDVVAKAGADVIISNHSNYDGSKVKLPAVVRRRSGDPHPYIVGPARVAGYLTVIHECAEAALQALVQRGH